MPRDIYHRSVGKKAFSTLTTEKNGTFSMTLKGALGNIFVNWGDGSAVEMFTLTAGGVDCEHEYGSAAEKTIKISGALGSVTYLEANSMDVTSIANLALLTNLETVYFYVNNIISIPPLAGLTSLTRVNFAKNDITDITILAGLTSLEVLSIYDNPITYPAGGIAWPEWSGDSYDFRSIVTTAAEVGYILRDFAVSGMNNCSLNISGTNPNRIEPDSDADLATLEGNTVVVTVNEA